VTKKIFCNSSEQQKVKRWNLACERPFEKMEERGGFWEKTFGGSCSEKENIIFVLKNLNQFLYQNANNKIDLVYFFQPLLLRDISSSLIHSSFKSQDFPMSKILSDSIKICVAEEHNKSVRMHKKYPVIESIETFTGAWHKTIKSNRIRISEVNFCLFVE